MSFGFGIGEIGGRLFAVAFGMFFSGFSMMGTWDAVQHPTALNVAVSAVMLGGGLWVVGTGVVGVPMRSGLFVGGGPGFRRVKLAPAEPIIAHCWGAGEPVLSPSFWDNVFSYHWSGEFFLTDRRLILVTWRWERWIRDEPPLVWLRLAEIAEVRDLDDAAKSFMGMRAREIETHTGEVYSVWFRDPDVATRLGDALAADALPEVEGLPPGSRRTAADRIFRVLPGVLVLVVFTGLTFGQTRWPYVGGPRQGIILIWIVFMAVALYDVLNSLRTKRAKPARGSRA